MVGVEAALCVLLLCGGFICTLGDKHSLYYLYTIQSKSSTDVIYEFSVVTLLDGRQIDSYSSTDGIRTPKQDWLKEIKESEWKEGTDKLKYDGQQINKILDIYIEAFKHNKSDNHVLQWRNGCEVEKNSDGSVSVLNCVSEYGYDGQDLISYNWTSNKWSASVNQAELMEEEWNRGFVDQKCLECVDWLKIYLQYNTTVITQTPPDVHAFMKKYATDSEKLILTCMATGFYPKDVEVKLRKFRTSLPEHLLISSGVRPNEDGTYQLRKSVDIREDDTADYDCYVTHVTLNEPVIENPDKKCNNCPDGPGSPTGAVAGVVAVLLLLAGMGVILFVLKKRGLICNGNTDRVQATPLNGGVSNGLTNGHPQKEPEEEPLYANGNTDCVVHAQTTLLNAGGSDSSSDSGQGTDSTTSSNKEINAVPMINGKH